MPDIKNKITVVYRRIADLNAAEYNPRQLTIKQANELRSSLERFEFVDPIVINKNPERDNVVIGGHQRIILAAQIGYIEVPCVELNLSLEMEKELNVRLNKNTGQWDFELLANHFDTADLIEWGFTNEELNFFEAEPIRTSSSFTRATRNKLKSISLPWTSQI